MAHYRSKLREQITVSALRQPAAQGFHGAPIRAMDDQNALRKGPGLMHREKADRIEHFGKLTLEVFGAFWIYSN